MNLSIGVCSEKFWVTYKDYDNENYEVINPDVGEEYTGFYLSAAGVYNFNKRRQDMFIMLRVQSPSSAGLPDHYVLSYQKTAALQLMAIETIVIALFHWVLIKPLRK